MPDDNTYTKKLQILLLLPPHERCLPPDLVTYQTKAVSLTCRRPCERYYFVFHKDALPGRPINRRVVTRLVWALRQFYVFVFLEEPNNYGALGCGRIRLGMRTQCVLF